MKTRVLVVEDEVILAKNIGRFLTRQGCTITLVRTALDAISVALNGHIDIVLLDIELPDGNGLEAYAQLCQLLPRLQGIAMTGRPRPEYRLRAQQLQLRGFLVKPFPLALLAEQVQAFSRRDEGIPDQAKQHEVATAISAMERLAGPRYALI